MRNTAALALLLVALVVLCTHPTPTSGQTPAWQYGPTLAFEYQRHDGVFVPGPEDAPWANKVYFLGGRTSASTESPNIWMFDPVAGTYADTGADIYEDVSNYNGNLVLDDGTGRGPAIYVVGGADKDHGGSNIGLVQRYYPQTNEAEYLGPEDNWPGKVGGYVVGGMGSAVVNDIIYVFGGWETTLAPYFAAETWTFDPKGYAGYRWTNLPGAGLSVGRSYIQTAVQGGKIYAMGGTSGYVGGDLVPTSVVEVFDPAAFWNGWTALAPMPVSTAEGRGFGFQCDTKGEDPPWYGKLYVVAGGDWPDISSEVMEYDIATNTWAQAFPDLKVPRVNLSGTFIPLCTDNPDDGLPGMWVFGGRSYNGDDPPYGPAEYYPLPCSEPPAAPTLLAIENADGDGAYLVDWTDVPGQVVYLLQEDDNPGFTSPLDRYAGADTQLEVSGQAYGTWYYRVRASNMGGTGPWSNTESAVVDKIPPEAPVLYPISNADGNGEYIVDWSEVASASNYRLEEDDNSSFSSPTERYTGSATQFQIYGQEGGSWYYRVRAGNSYGNSPWSNTEAVLVIPEAPVLLDIGNPDGDGDYLVDWNEVAGASAYELQEDDSSLFTSPATRYAGANSQYQVSSQPYGIWYYRVRASNAGGSSAWSNTEQALVDHAAPQAPVLYSIINPDGNVDYLVDWSDAAGATSYRLEEDDNPGFTSPTMRYAGGESEYQISGQQSRVWYYRARASNAYGNSPWSNTESVTVLPAAPVLLPISNPDGNGDYLTDWTDVPAVWSYCLEEDDNPDFASPVVRYLGANSQYEVLGQWTEHWYYRVRATNGLGDGPWSNVEGVAVLPDPPVLYPIDNSDGDGDYVVAWNDVAGAAGYLLQEDDNSGFVSPVVRYEGAGSQYPITGQQTGSWYYRVLATNEIGDSWWSNTESATVGEAPLEAPILYPIANVDGDGDCLIDWTFVYDATGYVLEEDDTPYFGSPVNVYEGSETSYQVMAQPCGAWYYRVRAYNNVGSSPWSDTQTTIVLLRLYLPTVLRGF